MAKKKFNLLKVDLKVTEAMDLIPKADNYCAFYMSAEANEDLTQIKGGFVKCLGLNDAQSSMLMAFMLQGEEQKNIIYNAVLNYFLNKPKEIENFLKHIDRK